MRLTANQFQYCLHTISPKAFYPIALDALCNSWPLSVVRVCDGEKILLDEYFKSGEGLFLPTHQLTEDWLKRYGLYGITREELYRRIIKAGTDCTHFAPSISGILNKEYALWNYFPERKYYIDNFFVNDWSWEMKQELFQTAKHVLFIHGNPHTADSMQLRVQSNLGVKVSWIQLTNWTQSESVIEQASKINAPLVLFSGGAASKYISHEIATKVSIPKVVLDLGAAAQHWTFEHLPADRAKAEEFHRQWVKQNG